nr:type I secretion C-terminal target domain-containing protein [Duganella rivi]
MIGTDLDDFITGGNGADSINGGKGTDSLDGGDGNDTLSAQGDATMIGGNGNDALSTTGGNKLLDGGDGNDSFLVQTISGGNVLALGGAGADKFNLHTSQLSAQGAIQLDGGDGDDLFNLNLSGTSPISYSFTGGAGADLYKIVKYSAGVSFRIEDFQTGSGADADRIDITELVRIMLSSGGYRGGNPFSADVGYFRLVQDGADTQLQFDQDGPASSYYGYRVLATFANVKATDLTSYNFTPYTLPDGAAGPGQLLEGTDAADRLNGSLFADTINGGAGNDTLSGDYGDDVLSGGDGNDYLSDYSGTSTLHGGAGADSLQGSGLVYGEDGNDIIDIGTGVFDGGAGDDWFKGGGGDAVTLLGGLGNDRFSLTSFGYTGLAADGGEGDDVFIIGQSGGSGGRGSLTGGAGSDTYRLETSTIYARLEVTDFTAGAGGDSIDLSYLLDLATSNGAYHGGNPFAANGGLFRLEQRGADTVLQYTAQNSVRDLITLKNVLASQLTADNFTGGLSPDGSAIAGVKLTGTSGSDTLAGTNYDDRLEGGAGADSLSGKAGNDLLLGGDESGAGDTLDGGEGDDTLDGGNGDDSLQGGAGNDSVSGGLGNDTLADSGGNGLLDGGAGNDVFELFGGHGALTIAGGSGDDLVIMDRAGSASSVIAAGGEGSDTYRLASSYGLKISDFATGAGGDRLDLTALLENADFNGYLGGNPFAADQPLFRLVQSGADTLVQCCALSNGVPNTSSYYTVATLSNVRAASLTADNFVGRINPNGAYTPGTRITGGAGDDNLGGTHFDDTLAGGAGNDSLTASRGSDVLDGGDGDDNLRLASPGGKLTATGGAGNDSFLITDSNVYNSSTRTLLADGGSGDDYFNLDMGGTGKYASTLVGGAGHDYYHLDGAHWGDSATVRDSYVVQDFTAGPGGDRIDLSELLAHSANIFTYLGGNPFVDGTLQLVQQGKDTLLQMHAGGDPKAAWVTLLRLQGVQASSLTADNFAQGLDPRGGSVAGSLIEQANNGLWQGGLFNDTLLGSQSVARMNGGGGDDLIKVSGNLHDVTLSGENGNDTLLGDLGGEVFWGGAGHDSMNGGAGDDVFVAGSGKDTVEGGTGNDVLQVSASFAGFTVTRTDAVYTTLTDASGNSIKFNGIEMFKFNGVEMTLAQVLSQLQANSPSANNDYIEGDSGSNTLNGLAGSDTLAGGAGDDTYVIDTLGDTIIENAGEGRDLVQVALASAGTYVLAANVENATVTAAANIAVNLTGNDLDNALIGNAAANTLTGGAGNDTLDGAAGADKLIGGAGDDTYVVDNAGDVVTELAGEGADTVRTTLSTLTLAANVEHLVYTGAATFAGTGNALNNVISGGDQDDKLDGGAGNDKLLGGLGNDSLVGGLGNDSFIGVVGKDTIDGGDGNDMLQGLDIFENYTITRPNATDTVLTDKAGNVTTVRNVEFFEFINISKNLAELQFGVVSVGNDTLAGGDGNDSLDGLAGADVMIGGKGDDIYVIDNPGDTIIENGDEGNDLAQVALTSAGTYVLGSNVENAIVTAVASVAVHLTGNGMSNQLTGNAAANTLIGGAGDDTLNGGAGADKLIGGAGDDAYVVDNSGDTITEAAGEGTDSVSTSLASYTLGANLETLAYTGSAAFTGTGNALNNIITGGSGDKGNKLDGGAGNDKLSGGIGNDSLIGGLGNDTFVGAAGKDTIDGGDGTDLLQGLGDVQNYTVSRPNATDTVLTDKAGNVITVRNVEFFEFANISKNLGELQFNIASVGNDTLTGGDGNDSINGQAGADVMIGGKGNDTYVIDNVGDTIVENGDEGTDLAQVALASAGTYVLGSNVENATVTAAASVAVSLTGNSMSNQLTGNAAANTLTGGAGDDTLDGGAGADKLIGGVGHDIYLVDNSGDVVTEGANEGYDTVRTTLSSLTLAANVEYMEYTGKGAFTGTGNALDNLITGGDGDNKLDGGAGNDALTGGHGNDSLLGGLGDDLLVITDGKDTADGGAGTDRLILSYLQDAYQVTRPSLTDTVLTDRYGNSVTVRNVEKVLFGDGSSVSMADLQQNIASPGNDYLTGTTGKDTINGGAGVDTLEGYAGDDLYTIGDKSSVIIEKANEGIDTVQVALSAAGTYQLAANVENATVTAAAGIAVNLTGNELANQLTGNAAANILIGGAGNDTLDGGAGADKMSGGTGDDDYYVSDAGDVVTELAGEGKDFVFTSLSTYALTPNVEVLLYTGSGAFTGTGNAENNVIVGGNGGAKLDGLAGNDLLSGGLGSDSLQGGLGDDTMLASLGKDTIDGGAGEDLLSQLDSFENYKVVRVNATDTLLTHVSGATTLVRNVENFNFNGTSMTLAEVQDNSASGGADTINGTDGNDLLDGGAGNDVLIGGLGDDTYVLSAPGDVVAELAGEGYDGVQLAFTAAGTYNLAANVEFATVTAAAGVAVSVTGNALDNYLTGNAAANTLSGGSGNDTLNGGAGNDTLIGGSGDDEYSVSEAGDVVKENANEGYDKVFTSTATYTLSANVEEVVFVGKGAFSGIGNDGNNRLFAGSSSGAKLDGGAGSDTLIGNSANDSLIGGAGDDWFQASAGKDTVDGGAGIDGLFNLGKFEDYTISRPNATDTVLTDKAGNVYSTRGVENFYFANEVVKTLAQLQENVATIGNDLLGGTDGNDTLDGGTGADTLAGGLGDDVYIIDNAGDVITEAVDAGYDIVNVGLGSGAYAMAANVEEAYITSVSGAVNITGNSLDNYITGNAGANKLSGGDGDDTLNGGAGNDTLSGGAGNDHLVGGVGIDNMAGGMGNDVYYVDTVGDLVVEAAGEGIDLVYLLQDAAKQAYTLPANVENLLFKSSGAFRATGNALDNIINSHTSSGAVIDGAAGNDTLYGGVGNDSLLGGIGDDELRGGTGIDIIDGGAGNDSAWLTGALGDYMIGRPNATDLVLTDRNGNVTTVRNVESLHFADTTLAPGALTDNVATTGADVLHGSDGNDTIDGLAGNDTLSGGDGNDLYVVNAAGDVIVELSGQGADKVNVAFTAAGTYVLSDNVENASVTAAASIAVNITGNALDNLLVGNAAANTLLGGDGNDTLDGGAGSDSLVGGTGDDLYWLDAAGDKVVEAAGAGIDCINTSLDSYTLTANVENLLYTSVKNFTGTGNELANTIWGNVGADVLNGAGGNDTLVGGSGNDKLTGGAGAGADTFVFNSLLGSDSVTDFTTGVDVVQLDLEMLRIGNNDAALDGAVTRSAPGGFNTHAELVLFTQKMASASTANAAAVIGSASSAYAVGETALFAVPTSTATVLYRFQSANSDAVVSASELTVVATLTGTPTTALNDYAPASS